MRRKQFPYPKPLIFNTSSTKPLTISFEKGYFVGNIDIIISGSLDNDSVKVNLRSTLWDNNVLALINWLTEWRKAHEHNNGPLERKMVRKMVSMLVPA